MLHRTRTVWMSSLLCGALTLASAAGAGARQQTPAKDPPRPKDFGSSLKRLKWDEKKKASVEKDDAKRKADAGGTDEEVVRVETSLVVSNVLVLDPRGRAVTGLTREDFVVSEDGRPQEVAVFAPGDSARVPRSIVLVIDYSGSQSPYLKTSVEAAKALVEQLGPGDRMAVVTDDVKLLVGFTQDKGLLKERLDSLKALATRKDAMHGWFSGHSLQYSALLATLRELFDEEDVRPVVVFQTDGDELAILRKPEGGVRPPSTVSRPFSLGDVYRAAEASRATVYSVIPGPRLIGLPPDELLKRARGILEARLEAAARATGGDLPPALRRVPTAAEQRWDAEQMLVTQKAVAGLAALTGGWTEFLEDPSQAAGIYSRIASDVGSRYVVGYYPTNKARDGSRRRVSIEVRGHPEYVLLGRKTYRAPED